ncbi:MAG: hypothetical protein HYZ42_07450 [Bacteroidetes bacterium]|nr:hypothetical protein [Bacteroidota bacterium]
MHAQSDLSAIRNQYRKAAESEKLTEQLYSELNKKKHISEVHQAYYAGVIAIKAKFAFWPIEKLSYVKNAMSLLDQSISKAPDNVEIRWIRYSIEINIPEILGYNHKATDKRVIIASLGKEVETEENKNHLKSIAQFMKQYAQLSKDELKLIAKWLD